MNEVLLKSLYDKSRVIKVAEWGDDIAFFDYRKFAELIVTECSRLCRESEVMIDIDLWASSTKKEMTEYTALGLAKKIEDHFGIE